MSDEAPTQISWRVDDWMTALGRPFSRGTFYNYVAVGKIQVRKTGRNLLVTTRPAEFLASCPTTLGPAPGRKRSAA